MLMAMVPVTGRIKLAFHMFGMALFVVNIVLLMTVLKVRHTGRNGCPQLPGALLRVPILPDRV